MVGIYTTVQSTIVLTAKNTEQRTPIRGAGKKLSINSPNTIEHISSKEPCYKNALYRDLYNNNFIILVNYYGGFVNGFIDTHAKNQCYTQSKPC